MNDTVQWTLFTFSSAILNENTNMIGKYDFFFLEC